MSLFRRTPKTPPAPPEALVKARALASETLRSATERVDRALKRLSLLDTLHVKEQAK